MVGFLLDIDTYRVRLDFSALAGERLVAAQALPT
jgi:hypothetical protein